MSFESGDVHSIGDDSRDRAQRLALIAGGATVVFGLLTIATTTRATARLDRALAPKLAARPRSRLRKRAAAIAPAGKWYVLLPASLAIAGYVLRARRGAGVSHRRRQSAATAVAVSGIAAAILEKAFDEFLPQPPIPAGRQSKREGVFPSGHSFVATAVGLTAAYVLTREELTNAVAASLVAFAVPVISGGAKLLTRKHWPSDVLAGVASGVAVAGACTALYETARNS